MRQQLTKDINTMTENDTINVLLYGLYRLTKVPEYAIISELAYVLDKDSLCRLCATLGGSTIKIPTMNELTLMTKSLYILQIIMEEPNTSFDEACTRANLEECSKQDVCNTIKILTPIIEEYMKDYES